MKVEIVRPIALQAAEAPAPMEGAGDVNAAAGALFASLKQAIVQHNPGLYRTLLTPFAAKNLSAADIENILDSYADNNVADWRLGPVEGSFFGLQARILNTNPESPGIAAVFGYDDSGTLKLVGVGPFVMF